MFLGLGEAKGDPYAAVGQAKKMINDMLTEVVHDIDKAHQDCKSIFEEKCQLMEFNRQDIDELNAEYAAANGKIVESEAAISWIEQTELPRLNDLLAENIKMCNEKIAELTSFLETTEHDIGVINGVVDMINCGEAVERWNKSDTDKEVSTQMSLLGQRANLSLVKCSDCQGNTTVKFQHPVLQQKIATIKSESVRHQVQQALNSLIQKEQPYEVPPNPCDGVTYDDAGVSPPGGPCSVSTNPRCKKLLTKFLEIQVSMQELNTSIRKQLAETEAECARVQRNLKAEIAEQSTLLLQHETELAFATQTVQRTNLQAGMKRTEFDEFAGEVENLRNECSTNLRAYEAEKCQLEKIRSEIFIKIKGGTKGAMFVDCEVSEWVSSGCSVSCGKGTETQTRIIKELPQGGIKCPPLNAVLPCNTHACPVDCEEATWSPWSSCSAQCDGGIKLRTRTVLTHPTRGGRPCEAITETESCHMESCDPDCELYDWGGWSQCSKACNSGHMHRIRAVMTPAKNMGKCPGPYDLERYDETTCNDHACAIVEVKGWTETAMVCKAKVDVVLIIDASESLKEEGFEESKKFAKAFVSAFEGQDAQLSVIQFGGPLYWEDFYYCTDNINADLSEEYMKNVCGIKLVQELSNDTQTTLDNIGNLTWDEPPSQGTTFTSGALLMAREVLRFARQDVEHIVVTLTDGLPIDVDHTTEAADMVKSDGARLVFAGVGLSTYGEQYLQGITSTNTKDNLVIIEDTLSLGKMEPVNTLIEDVCGLGSTPTLEDTCEADGSTACAPWCESNGQPWASKCTWLESCAGCSTCASTCFEWCEENTEPWKYKCNWECCKRCPTCSAGIIEKY